MKKFLSLEDSQYLINNCHISPINASYVEVIEHQEGEHPGALSKTIKLIKNKKDCFYDYYDKYGAKMGSKRSWDQSDSIFSLSDLIRICGECISSIIDEDTSNELIDELFTYLKNR